MPERSQPPMGPAAPDDVRSYDAGSWFGQMANALKSGWNHVALFKKSVRVGSSTALAAADGLDGAIVASGPMGQFTFGDRTTPANSAAWYRDANIFLYNGAANIWQIAPATGQIAQDALTTLTAGTSINFTNAGFTAQGTRLVKPTGMIYLSFRITCTAAIGAFATVATVAAAHQPTGFVRFVATKNGTAAVQTFYITSAGAINTPNALANGDTYEADFVYYQ